MAAISRRIGRPVLLPLHRSIIQPCGAIHPLHSQDIAYHPPGKESPSRTYVRQVPRHGVFVTSLVKKRLKFTLKMITKAEERAIDRCCKIYSASMDCGKTEVALKATQIQYEIEREIEKREEEANRIQKQKRFRAEIEQQTAFA